MWLVGWWLVGLIGWLDGWLAGDARCTKEVPTTPAAAYLGEVHDDIEKGDGKKRTCDP